MRKIAAKAVDNEQTQIAWVDCVKLRQQTTTQAVGQMSSAFCISIFESASECISNGKADFNVVVYYIQDFSPDQTTELNALKRSYPTSNFIVIFNGRVVEYGLNKQAQEDCSVAYINTANTDLEGFSNLLLALIAQDSSRYSRNN